MSEEYVCYQCGGFGCHHCNYLPHVQTGEKYEQKLQTQYMAAQVEQYGHKIECDAARATIAEAKGKDQ